MQNRFLNAFLLFISILSITACGGGGGGGGGGDGAPALQNQTISFTESGTIELLVEDVRTTTASAQSSGAIQFSLSETGIIDIDASGTVTALAAGTTTLTLTAPADSSYKGATLSIPVVVNKHQQPLTFTNGYSIQAFVDSSLSNPVAGPGSGDYHYGSTNTDIASVNDQGLVTLLSAGDVSITVNRDEDEKYLASSAAYVLRSMLNEQSLSFSQNALQLPVDGNQANPATGAQLPVSYVSSDNNVASVDAAGQVTAMAAGTATITATAASNWKYAGISAQYTVTSNRIEQSIAFAQAGPFEQFVDDSVANPASGGAGDGAISYNLSNPDLATIDAAGNVTLNQAGSLVVTATKAQDRKYASASAQFTVTSNRIEQSIAFVQAGPFEQFVDDSVANPASGGAGDGAINYNLSNPDLATIDAAGNVTLNQAGSLVVTATKAQDRKYASASAQYAVTSNRIEQSIAFAQTGPLEQFVDDILINPATGGAGAGEMSYSLSNPDLATVDAAGNVTLDQAGSLVVTATKAQDRKYNSASAQYTVHTSLIDQTIEFGLTEPVREITQAFFTKSLTDGPGEGATSYTSSNELVASVDATGQVTVLSPGLATITATKAAGRKYNQASDGYDIDAVNRTTSFVAWVGADSSAGQFEAGSEGVEFVASQDAMCNFDNANACTQGQHQILSSAETTDAAFTLNNKGFYQFRFGDYHTQLPVNTQRWEALVKHKVVNHQGQLVLMGGSKYQGYLSSVDVWISNDGIDWTLISTNTAIPHRHETAFVSFKGKLWFIGGRYNSTYGDIWSSADGVSWTREVALADFGQRSQHHLAVMGDQLYLVGGRNDALEFTNDVWASDDGISWHKVADFVHNSELSLLTSYDNRLWLFTSNAGNNYSTFMSEDGANWHELTDNLPFVPAISGSIAVHENRIWVQSSEAATPWSSTDGITWRQEAVIPAGKIHSGALAVINDQLLLIAGGHVSNYAANDEIYRYQDQNWLLISDQTPGNKQSAVIFNYNDSLHLLSQTGSLNENHMLSSEDAVIWQVENKPDRRGDSILPKPLELNGKLWLIEGSQAGIGRSQYSLNGNYWQKLQQRAPWPNRSFDHQLFKHNDRIWIMGGSIANNPSLHLNDLWSTLDGENWQQHASNELFTRSFGTTISFKGKIMLFGGKANNAPQSDVWSSIDGETWIKEADTTGFGARTSSTLFEFQNRLWLIGGYNEDTRTWTKDIWSSADGINWQLEADDLPLGQQLQPSVTVKDNMIYLSETKATTGNRQYGIWRSSDGIHWQKRYQHQAHFPLHN